MMVKIDSRDFDRPPISSVDGWITQWQRTTMKQDRKNVNRHFSNILYDNNVTVDRENFLIRLSSVPSSGEARVNTRSPILFAASIHRISLSCIIIHAHKKSRNGQCCCAIEYPYIEIYTYMHNIELNRFKVLLVRNHFSIEKKNPII